MPLAAEMPAPLRTATAGPSSSIRCSWATSMRILPGIARRPECLHYGEDHTAL